MFPLTDIMCLLMTNSYDLDLTSQRSRAYEIDWKTTIQLTHYIYLQSADIKEGLSKKIHLCYLISNVITLSNILK